MTQKLDYLNINVVNTCAPSSPSGNCGSFDHVTLSYQVWSPFSLSSSDLVAYVNNVQPSLNLDPYSNTFNLGWKNHPNLSYESDPLPFPQAKMLGPHLSVFKDLISLHKLHKSPTYRL